MRQRASSSFFFGNCLLLRKSMMLNMAWKAFQTSLSFHSAIVGGSLDTKAHFFMQCFFVTCVLISKVQWEYFHKNLPYAILKPSLVASFGLVLTSSNWIWIELCWIMSKKWNVKSKIKCQNFHLKWTEKTGVGEVEATVETTKFSCRNTKTEWRK